MRLVPYGIKNLRKFLGLQPASSPGDSRRRVREVTGEGRDPQIDRSLRRKKWLKRVQDTDNVRDYFQENSEVTANTHETVGH